MATREGPAGPRAGPWSVGRVRRRRYAIVGTGSRAGMFIDALAGTYRETTELVGLCDVSQARMDWHNRRLATMAGVGPRPTYLADRFDRMVADTRPDTVIVTTVDATHHLYITRAMELGCDVITEKPMTTDAAKMRAIFDAIARTGRLAPGHLQLPVRPGVHGVRRLMMEGRRRATPVRRLLVAPGHAARRGLLPALAPGAGELGWAAGAQGDPPLRPRELVDRLVPARRSSPWRRSASTDARMPRRGASPTRTRATRATRRRGTTRSPCSSTGAPRCAGCTSRPRRRAATSGTGTSSGSRSPSTTR